jgi:hypothetical protein
MRTCANYLLQISACAALTAILALPAHAAGLQGRVTYGTNAVASAIVSVYQESTRRKSVTISNSRGEYAFNNLPSGSYIVLVEKDGRRIYQGRATVPQSVARFDIEL